jgi:hypothetical protein
MGFTWYYGIDGPVEIVDDYPWIENGGSFHSFLLVRLPGRVVFIENTLVGTVPQPHAIHKATTFLETVLTRARSKAAAQEVLQRAMPVLVEVVCPLARRLLGGSNAGSRENLRVKHGETPWTPPLFVIFHRNNDGFL